MTPGDVVFPRGMFAVCYPQGQIHLVWIPASDFTRQSCARSAVSTSRRFIALTTTVTLVPLGSETKGD